MFTLILEFFYTLQEHYLTALGFIRLIRNVKFLTQNDRCYDEPWDAMNFLTHHLCTFVERARAT